MILANDSRTLRGEDIDSIRTSRRTYLICFFLMIASYAAASLGRMAFLYGVGLALGIVFVAYFKEAVTTAFGYRSWRIFWLVLLVAILPFAVNVPLFIYDSRLHRLLRRWDRDWKMRK